MKMNFSAGRFLLAAGIAMAVAAGCTVLPQAKPKSLDYYRLDIAGAAPGEVPVRKGKGAVLVSVPGASAALNSPNMAYIHRSQTQAYFARSRWVDTPPRMLQPLLAGALEQDGRLGAVIESAGTVRPDWRIETGVLNFQQDFTVAPSVFHLTLRVQVVNVAERAVYATRVFDQRTPAPSDNPHGGALAAGSALEALLPEVVAFVASAIGPRAGGTGSEAGD